MPRLADSVKEGISTHLLICGVTKAGKSDYIAQAVKDGFWVIHIDSDNGANTFKQVLKDDLAAQMRVLHIRTENPYEVMRLIAETNVVRWNVTKDAPYKVSGVPGAVQMEPNDLITEIRVNKIPRGVILAVDGWTSVGTGAIKEACKSFQVKWESMGIKSQAVLGEAGTRCTIIAAALQMAPFHVIVHAHGVFYEILEKPEGLIRDNKKQEDMTIKETILIPESCTKPHGYKLGKFFNEIGWMEIDRRERYVLDFKKRFDRIGGGTPGGIGDPRTDYRFSKLFGPPVSYTEDEVAEFWREYPVSAIVSTQAAPSPVAQKPAVPSGDLPSAGNPTGKNALSMMLKK